MIFLIGQTLNWMYNFGESKYSQFVKFIQLQSYPEDLHLNRTAEVAITGDIKAVIGQMNEQLQMQSLKFPLDGEWWLQLIEKKKGNEISMKVRVAYH